MISPLPTPTPDLSWIAHYLPTRTPEAACAVEMAGTTTSAPLYVLLTAALIIIAVALWIDYERTRNR